VVLTPVRLALDFFDDLRLDLDEHMTWVCLSRPLGLDSAGAEMKASVGWGLKLRSLQNKKDEKSSSGFFYFKWSMNIPLENSTK
jgi:hypothetical protein